MKKKRGRPKTVGTGTKVFPMRLDLSVLADLEAVAKYEGGRTVASVIRQAIGEYLRAHPQREDFSDLLAPAKPKEGKS